ncbi:Clavaminate synthase-like protein, partial [Cucurbita argyrosperma subsp. argyrosperma]
MEFSSKEFKVGKCEGQKEVDGETMPLVLQPPESDKANFDSLLLALQNNKDWLDQMIIKHSAVLLRGYNVSKPEEFNEIVEAFRWEDIRYVGPAPRTHIYKRIWTANEGPLSEFIYYHHEMVLIKEYPKRVILYCEIPPPEGGETPFVPSFKVTERMVKEFPKEVEEMDKKGLKYTFTALSNNDTSSMRGRGWEDAFGSSDRYEAEKRANALGMEVEWLPNGAMKTILGPRCLTKVFDGRKGRRMWFNTMVGMHGKEHSSALMADGMEISEHVVKRCQQIIEEESIQFKWEKGDVLFLDNYALLHGRRPSLPPRRMMNRFGVLVSVSIAAYAIRQLTIRSWSSLIYSENGEHTEKNLRRQRRMFHGLDEEQEEQKEANSMNDLEDGDHDHSLDELQEHLPQNKVGETHKIEMERLLEQVMELEERKVKLEGELLMYDGIKNSEMDIMELKKQLEAKNDDINKSNITISSLQAERKELQEEIVKGALVKKELMEAKGKIKELQRQIQVDANQTKQHLLLLKQQVSTLQAKEEEALKKEVELYKKLRAEKDFEMNKFSEVEELVYLRWINACLRYELRDDDETPAGESARYLNKNSSPKSKEKAKQLMLEYAGTETDSIDSSKSRSSSSFSEKPNLIRNNCESSGVLSLPMIGLSHGRKDRLEAVLAVRAETLTLSEVRRLQVCSRNSVNSVATSFKLMSKTVEESLKQRTL